MYGDRYVPTFQMDLLSHSLVYTLKMEVAGSSETAVHISNALRRHVYVKFYILLTVRHVMILGE